MTTDKSWVRILIYNDCGTEKFLNVFFPVSRRRAQSFTDLTDQLSRWQLPSFSFFIHPVPVHLARQYVTYLLGQATIALRSLPPWLRSVKPTQSILVTIFTRNNLIYWCNFASFLGGNTCMSCWFLRQNTQQHRWKDDCIHYYFSLIYIRQNAAFYYVPILQDTCTGWAEIITEKKNFQIDDIVYLWNTICPKL